MKSRSIWLLLACCLVMGCGEVTVRPFVEALDAGTDSGDQNSDDDEDGADEDGGVDDGDEDSGVDGEDSDDGP